MTEKLSTEEKAKRYDEAIKNAKDIYTYECDDAEQLRKIERMFPELKESGDEMIRKDMIETIKKESKDFPSSVIAEKSKSWLAYLEKQGEQKFDTDFSNLRTWKYIVDAVWTEKEGIGQYLDSPFTEEVAKKLQKRFGNIEQKTANKIEPKFRKGDWIITPTKEVLQITSIEGTNYRFNNESSYWGIRYCDKKCRLWTIEDAKDGDILAFKNNIGGIIICKSPTSYDTGSYCRLVGDNLINKEEYGWYSTSLVPATKEQRELLFQKWLNSKTSTNL